MNGPTKVYGASDDLIEFEGGIVGEVGCYGTDEDRHPGVLVVFSDGTVISVKYGKPGIAVWAITVLREGDCFESLETTVDEDADPYSDVARFGPGLKWAHAAKDWSRVG